MCGGSRVFGLERMALSIIRGLHERGHSVHCLISSWGDGDFPSRLQVIGVPYERVPLGKVSLTVRLPYVWWTVKALAYLPLARRRCRRHLENFRPHVVIFYDRDWMVMNDQSVEEPKTIFHVHGMPSERLPSESRLNAWRIRKLDRRTAKYVVISRSIRDALLRLGISATKTFLVYNGVERAEAPENNAAGSEPPTIGIVGQVAPWKGHDDLIEALRILRDANFAFRCIIFGSGDTSYVGLLREQIENFGLTDRIKWAGYVRSTSEIFGQIDICVMPSRIDESFGLVAAEAGLRAIPVVASRRGALPEIVRDGETGLLVPSASPRELAEALGRLLACPEVRRSLGSAAREHILRSFLEERMVEQMEELCLQLAE